MAGAPGFFANFKTSLPFGMSNQSNNVAQPNNPNFPASKQLEQKNPGADPNNQPQNNNGNNEPNNNQQNNPDPNKGEQGSQLDAFKDIFTLPSDKDGNPIQHVDPLSQPLMQVDPKKLQDAAKQMNFTAGITAEMVTKAMQDPQELLKLLNVTAQNGFAAALQGTSGIVERSFSDHTKRFDAALPDRIRNTQIKNAETKHPALSHPAAAPLVASLKSTIAATNPNLSPERVAEMAENYVIAMSSDVQAVNNRQQEANKPKDPSEIDWSALLNPGQ